MYLLLKMVIFQLVMLVFGGVIHEMLKGGVLKSGKPCCFVFSTSVNDK